MEIEAFGQGLDRSLRLSANKQKLKTDRIELAGMDDKTLAEWQAGFEQTEAQWRLAEHEWQRRLTAAQISATMRAARGQAWFGGAS
jgi:hypothetical protein